MVKLKMRVGKDVILASLKKQLEEHVVAHEAAKAAWRVKMLSIAKQIVEQGGELTKFPRALEELQYMPRSNAEELKALIKRFETALDDDFELDTGDYETLMEGKWHWMYEFNATNSRYGSTGSTGSTGSLGVTGATGGSEQVQEISATLDKGEIEE